MSNVVSIDGGDIADGREPNCHAVGTLEDLLTMAKSGELVGIVAVCAFYDHTIQPIRSGQYEANQTIGGLNRLSFDILRATADD
ncbi:hypothetical protein L3V16_06185 [Brucella ciceri]|uniref:hypothetical protein n=1 Tax=Brucella ciceri TaxID=391287 RepID=UPI001F143683|nr:hypothetical protein [Brucella ciceri]MCH6203428.1 hypothetical protein [Brucella ciceri]